MGLVFQAYLMLGVGGDSLLAPTPDADEVGFREINSHGSQAIPGNPSNGSRTGEFAFNCRQFVCDHRLRNGSR
jgi:hypothetical protein